MRACLTDLLHFRRAPPTQRADSQAKDQRYLDESAKQPDTPATSELKFPYLVVRTFFGLYQREKIQIGVGPALVEIANRRCRIQHPLPFNFNGVIGNDCRSLLLSGVQHAVRGLRWRMCVVWSEASCTYVENDKLIESAHIPSGGEGPVDIRFEAPVFFPTNKESAK